MQIETVVVQCVFGDADVEHLNNLLIPSLSRSTKLNVEFLGLNFNGNLCPREAKESKRISVSTISRLEGTISGFGENHNQLFEIHRDKSEFFILLNPDCVLFTGAIDSLIKTYRTANKKAAIVEGRQWPFEHPKEYDKKTKETPWASGAFALVDSRFYDGIGGMDPVYFMYVEDVDLSWRAWLAGYTVLYERDAAVMHFTGGPFQPTNQMSVETYYSLRNFLVISYKFFGLKGELAAIRQLRLVAGHDFTEGLVKEFRKLKKEILRVSPKPIKHKMLKITGVNLYHEMNR